MEEKREFECFFRTLARYMQNNNTDIHFLHDGSIKIRCTKTGFEKTYSRSEVLEKICNYM